MHGSTPIEEILTAPSCGEKADLRLSLPSLRTKENLPPYFFIRTPIISPRKNTERANENTGQHIQSHYWSVRCC